VQIPFFASFLSLYNPIRRDGMFTDKEYKRLVEIDDILLRNGVDGKYISDAEFQSITYERAVILKAYSDKSHQQNK